MTIESVEGTGTTVSLSLLAAGPPKEATEGKKLPGLGDSAEGVS